MLKKVRLLSLVVLAVLLLSGSVFAQQKVVLNAMLGGEADYKPLVDLFNEQHPNIEVVLHPAPPTSVEKRDRFVTMFAAQDGGLDLLLTSLMQTAEYGASGWLEPLDGWVDADRIKTDTFDAYIEAAIWDGQLLGIPYSGDALHLYYRKDLLEEAGFDPPTTWDELIEQARQLQTSDIYGFVASWERGNQILCQWLMFAGSNGGQILDENGKVIVNSQANVEALEKMIEIVGEVAPRDVLTLTVDDARTVFTEGRAVFHINWDYVWRMCQDSRSKVVDKVGITVLPSFPGRDPVSILGGWKLSINKFSKNKEAAAEFLRWASSPEICTWFVLNTSQTSCNSIAMSDSEYVARDPEFIDALFNNYNNTISRPVIPEYGELVEIMSQAIFNALYGRETPKQALDKAAAQLESLLNY